VIDKLVQEQRTQDDDDDNGDGGGGGGGRERAKSKTNYSCTTILYGIYNILFVVLQ
jgi:hypothetical protein